MKIKSFILISILFAFRTLYGQNYLNTEIGTIEFVGNEVIKSSVLFNVITSKESPGWFSQFLHKFTNFGGDPVYFNDIQFQLDIDKIKAFYLDQGYFKAKISGEYITDSTDLITDIKFTINENEPAYINKFEMKGLDRVYPDFLLMIKERLTIDKGLKYSANLVRQNINIINNFLGDRGYLFINSSNPVITVDTMKNQVDINVKFSPGKRYTVKDIVINKTGSNKDNVDDKLLYDIVGIKSGDFYNRYDIQKAQVRLYRTNLFNSAIVMATRSDTTENSVPILISADVGKLYQVSPEIILNNEDDLFNVGLLTEFSKRNFFGDARKFSVGFSIASQNPLEMIKRLSVSDTTLYGYVDSRITFEQPFLFGSPINSKLETYYTLQKRKNDFSAVLFGARINLEFELPRYTFASSFSTYLNWENSEFTYKENFLRTSFRNLFTSLNIDQEKALRIIDSLFTEGKIKKKYGGNNVTLGFDIGMNRTDDPSLIFPTEGYNVSVLFENGNLIPFLLTKIIKSEYDDPLYYKVQFTATRYSDFFNLDRGVFASKFKVGVINAFKGDKFRIPINQRFNAGGSNSVRAWESRSLIPDKNKISVENLNFENFNNSDFDAVVLRDITPGGFYLIEGAFEARMHLSGDFGTAVFMDFGNTWNNINEISIKQIAVGIGFGIRYYSPFAPVRIDFGFKIYDPNDNRSFFNRIKSSFKNNFEFQIGIGEAF